MVYEVNDGIKVDVKKKKEIVVKGIEKKKVGKVEDEIREYRGKEN